MFLVLNFIEFEAEEVLLGEDEDHVALLSDPISVEHQLVADPYITSSPDPMSKVLSHSLAEVSPPAASVLNRNEFESFFSPSHALPSSRPRLISFKPNFWRFLIPFKGIEKLQATSYASVSVEQSLLVTSDVSAIVLRVVWIVWNFVFQTSFTCSWIVQAISISSVLADSLSTLPSASTLALCLQLQVKLAFKEAHSWCAGTCGTTSITTVLEYRRVCIQKHLATLKKISGAFVPEHKASLPNDIYTLTVQSPIEYTF